MSVSIAIGEEMLTRLREAIIHQYPVNTETLATNYQKLFREIINPQEFGCQNFLLFVYKIQLEHGIWETNKTNNQTLVKPSKETILRMDSPEGEFPTNPKSEKLPEDALVGAELPPLNKKGTVEEKNLAVVVSDMEGPQKFWFQIYSQSHYCALQCLMKDLDSFYKSALGDRYRVRNISEVKLGTVLAAKFDGVYHRVAVESILVHNRVKLEYIDYGTKDTQSVENCRYLTPSFTKLPAQAIEARLWGLAPVKGAKTEDGKDVRAKMWELINDCLPGTIMAVVKSGVNIPEFGTVQGSQQEVMPNMSTKRRLALQLFDVLKGGEGKSIGDILLEEGLVKREVREEKHTLGGELYYVVEEETDQPSVKLKLLRQHEAYLATRLEQFQIRARSQEDSARLGKIKERIQDFQSKLELIKERREKVEEKEND